MNSALTSANAPQPSRTLDRLRDAADRVAGINDRLFNMLGRVHGQDHPVGPNDAICVSYIDQLGRLHGNLDLLDKLTDELAEHI